MSRLSQHMLAALPGEVARPRYDRTALCPGIVHLGLGAFHRAHQAAYTEQVLAGGDLRWGTVAASLRSPATRDALAPQDGLYVLNTRGEDDAYTVIGGITDILVAPDSPTALVEAMARPGTAIVSLTVTEKAYCLDAATRGLDEAHPDVMHDLAHPQAPRSALGILAAAIARRRAEGLPQFTVLCCDNLPANGATVHRALSRFARLRAPELGAFVEDELACPDTMVDRIVPATVAADRARVAAATGLADAWPVVAEPFTQWVIEDRFPVGRPAWDEAGATMTANVAPWEAMKLRLLNASHSALAYFGVLAGAETVADAMQMPGMAGLVEQLMGDAAATIALPPGTDIAGYRRSLITRFRNPALQHRTRQIAMDGTQKLPGRILATVQDRLDRGLPITAHAAVIAAWVRCVTGPDDSGRPIAVEDPLAATLARTTVEAGPEPGLLVTALLNLPAVFGSLGQSDRLQNAVADVLGQLRVGGSHGTLLQFL